MTEEQKAARAENLAKARARQQEKVRAIAAAPKVEPIPVREPGESPPVQVPGERPEDLPDGAIERRARLLADFDDETAALFSDDELARIEAEEHERAQAEQKKLALADVRALARQRARVAHELIPSSQLRSTAERERLAEPVRFKVTLPGEGAGHKGRAGFRVDGRLYQTGQTYTESRAVFESLRSNHYRAWISEIQFKTLDQNKAGNSAQEILAQTAPIFELAA